MFNYLGMLYLCQVPYTVTDETLGGVWECVNNVWDPAHNSCKVPQALQDEEIDEILAKQVGIPGILICFHEVLP